MKPLPLTVLLDRAGVAGGAERYWHIVLPALIEAGVDVRVLSRDVAGWGGDDGFPVPEAADYVRAHVRAAGGGTVITANVFDAGVLAAVRDEASHWIVRLHDHRAFCPNGDRVFPQFDGICTGAAGWGCAVNALARGCMHGPRAASVDRLLRRLALRDTIARADRVLVSSRYMRASALRNRLDPQRVALTPPPLADTAYARPPRPRPERDTVLFAGRLTPRKGVQSFIRALAHIPPERRPLAVVAGSGDDESQARVLADRLGVAIDWRGWLAPRDLRLAIDAATLIAVPSLEAEPFGLVGIEAQARGRPAVAYDVGGIGDWLGSTADIAVRRGDERAFAAAIVEALAPARWLQLARDARVASEHYRLQPHVERMLDVIDARPIPDAVTAAEAAMRAERARPTRHSPAHPNRRVGGRRSSG